MSADTERLVRDVGAAWSRRSIDELLAFFTDDAVYHNMPVPPAEGHAAIHRVMELFVPPAESLDCQVCGMASAGATVVTEPVDKATGRPICARPSPIRYSPR